MNVIFLILAEILLTIFAMRLCCGLRLLMVLNLFVISLFAPKLMTIFWYTTNIGAILYAFVLLQQMIIFKAEGMKWLKESVSYVFFWVIWMTVITQGVNFFPWDTEVTRAIDLLAKININVAVASFSALFFTQITMLALTIKLQKVNFWIRYIVVITICQAIDSLIFFYIAFKTIWELAIVWFFVKIAISLVLAPVVYLLKERAKVLYEQRN